MVIKPSGRRKDPSLLLCNSCCFFCEATLIFHRPDVLLQKRETNSWAFSSSLSHSFPTHSGHSIPQEKVPPYHFPPLGGKSLKVSDILASVISIYKVWGREAGNRRIFENSVKHKCWVYYILSMSIFCSLPIYTEAEHERYTAFKLSWAYRCVTKW